MDLLNDIPSQLTRWPLPVAIMLCTITVGIILKKLQLFPNRFIPLVVVPLNAVAYWYTGNPGTISPDVRHPECVLWVYGIILGFFAWGAHAFVLKKLAALLPAGVITGFDTDELRKPKGDNEVIDPKGKSGV